MRLAILSDIHGNLTALDAVLADLARRGPFDALGVAGDLCEWGPYPRDVLQRVRGLGLLGMEERVRHLGGTFEVDSRPGCGTMLKILLPLASMNGDGHNGSNSHPAG